jgi:hypothetical protein
MRSPALRLAAALLAAAVLAAAPAPAALAQEDGDETTAAYVRSHYTKREVRIPMRDGVELFTSIYLPDDATAEKTYPVLLNRTPYSVRPYGADEYKRSLGPGDAYPREGFIFVYQDVRGKYLSEGEFVNMRPHRETKGPREVDESTDTWDTLEWLVENLAEDNGKVGLWGISYPGFYASAGAIDSHPALAAVSPQAPIADWFWDDMHHHGAFILPLGFNFFASFGQPRPEPTTKGAQRFVHGTPDGWRWFLDLGPLSNVNERHLHGEVEFWNQIAAHPNYDEFWQSRNLLPHLDGITAPVMTVGGWFDAEDLYGPLHTYRSIEEKNPGIFNVLVMGPWPHGGWSRGEGRELGDADFGFATSQWYSDNVELPFFRHFLKGGPAPALPEALMFETGADRWRRFDRWPPPGVRETELYFREGGTLAFEPPAAAEAEEPAAAAGEAKDTWVSDPDHPVPYTTRLSAWWEREYMAEDQRFASRRPDVLTYVGEPLEEDLTLAGPLTADLWVSTSGGDSDWVVKLIDVHPVDEPSWEEWTPRQRRDEAEPDTRGMELLVRGEVFRGRFRNSYEHPEPFLPGEPTRVRIPLQDVLHTFQRGHRIMIQVQSTWFPLVDRNPGTWVDNIFEAEEDDFVPVTNSLYRSPERPSRLVVGVLE